MLSGSLQGVRVLYIDDDPGIARLVQKHLERGGCRVVTAADGASGVVQAAAEPFDAIALDHYMPGEDGLALLPTLLSLPDTPPIIFVTAAEEPRIAVAAMQQGAADYVIKDTGGIFLNALGTAIRRALDRTMLRRQKDAAEQALRDQRDRLAALTEQQALLLREVNHRVANSLQLITALIDMQACKLRDPEAKEALRRAAERVDAVSLVHRRLYTSDDVTHVALDQYLSGLIEDLRRANAGGLNVEAITLQADPVLIETDKAVPLGLIVNELVTNAVKYAYTGDARGEIRVALTRGPDAVLVLTVEDDGAGMPPETPADPTQMSPTASKGTGLGTLIVRAMAQTLRAAVAFDPAHAGARFTVSVPARA